MGFRLKRYSPFAVLSATRRTTSETRNRGSASWQSSTGYGSALIVGPAAGVAGTCGEKPRSVGSQERGEAADPDALFRV